MTPDDKKRIEEIRKSWINGVEPVPFLLAQLDEAHGQIDVLEHVNQKTQERLDEAHAALRQLADSVNEQDSRTRSFYSKELDKAYAVFGITRPKNSYEKADEEVIKEMGWE